MYCALGCRPDSYACPGAAASNLCGSRRSCRHLLASFPSFPPTTRRLLLDDRDRMRSRPGLAVLCTAAAYVSAAAPGPQVVFKTCKAATTAHVGRQSPLPSSPVIPRPVLDARAGLRAKGPALMHLFRSPCVCASFLPRCLACRACLSLARIEWRGSYIDSPLIDALRITRSAIRASRCRGRQQQ